MFRAIELNQIGMFRYAECIVWYFGHVIIFPFLVVYNIDEYNQQILIVAVLHISRFPKRKYRL